MKYEQYRKELEQIRLTKESKAALIQALKPNKLRMPLAVLAVGTASP